MFHEKCFFFFFFFFFFNKRNGSVVMSLDLAGQGAAVNAGEGSNLTQPSANAYLFLYTFFLKSNLLSKRYGNVLDSFVMIMETFWIVLLCL